MARLVLVRWVPIGLKPRHPASAATVGARHRSFSDAGKSMRLVAATCWASIAARPSVAALGSDADGEPRGGGN